MGDVVVALEDGRILVRSIEFGQPPFRKLGSMRIEFAERVTLIAGHNGIGKSTILGLLTNTFGLTGAEHKTFFGESYFKNIEKIVYIAKEEAEASKANPKSNPVVSASFGNIIIRKRCSITERKLWNRARVVPRTVDADPSDPVGHSAKIPLPTIYLGMRRLASIGETGDVDLSSSLLSMDEADRKVIVDFVKSVILGISVNDQVTQTPVKAAGVVSVQPGFDAHDAMAISVGQDSLGSIATAFASFSKLKRDLGDAYPGGLLVIDEIDVGFHPHALERLAKAITKYARKFDVQVVATTHSPALIECIHPSGGGNQNTPDAVIYLLDTNTPRIAEDQSLKSILADMSLRQDIPPAVSKPKLGIYFEDEEGRQFFDELYGRGRKISISRRAGVSIQPIALGVGGSNLLQLPDHDPIFRDRILVVDADTTIPKKSRDRGNTAKLPCPPGAQGTDRSPENMIINFLKELMDAKSGPYYNLMLKINVANPSSDKIRSKFFSDEVKLSDRVSTKKWWITHWPTLKSWKIIDLWISHHSAQVSTFISDFEAAVIRTATRLQ
ncbi:AAA family ATPase [Stenotrophomonas sp. 2694]|uniref:AAA family ATPase n=1 Tax=Stenotrophomonas sp. 2694 TaxID=3156317 RepID=UPI0033997625